ncbi:hypothetical protein LZ575_11725 [Antarcticibacterium sp. 1MA-6-2]|uniref:hypothetical protein n=1 Tax=Antarcticibacterium sp. 1MA-6-2 TaxID=2908210 RepID=UPI001F356D90|nr:hypothetical protein [Antarcticibacterium sp. 1MA-6-2]UJH89726.1 hypothetical protein LZ575_11725 [Antarcticibacterium sp. 1MA-6-2]
MKNLEDEKNIIAYSFKYDLQFLYTKPGLFDQQIAYLTWLQKLISEIKSLDDSRSIVLELFLNDNTRTTIQLLNKTLPIDSYGLIINNTSRLEEVLNFAKEEDISVYISQLDSEIYLANKQLDTLDLLLKNWQNERSSSHLSFDGLLDFNGNKKLILADIETRWGGKSNKMDEFQASILKPAVPLYPGSSNVYNAVILEDNAWKLASENNTELKFMWSLIKNDTYGNALAIKELEEGPQISIEIPEQYENYELLLTVKKNGYTTSSKTSLHTPWKNNCKKKAPLK